jgi:hypothetical protein
MVDSFERHHMDQVLYLREHGFAPRQLAELVWTLSHRTIGAFLEGVPQERWVRLRFEDLVRDPAGQMEGLCSGLGLPFDPAVVRPYDGLDGKMVDGVYPESDPMGDPGFLAHGRIDPEAAALEAARAGARQLGEPTRELARSLGYDLGSEPGVDRRRTTNALARQRALRTERRGTDD